MLLAIALAGSGDVSIPNAKALLNDFIGDNDVIVYVPNYITQEQEGLRTAISCLPDEPVKVRKSMLIEKLEAVKVPEALELVFIILGPEGLDDLIEEAEEAGIPVLDMTKGLFQHSALPVVALDGSESNADALEEPAEGEHLGDVSDLVRIDPSAMTRKEVEDLIMVMIIAHEQKYHNGLPIEPQRPEILAPEVTVLDDAKAPETNYYRSKTGKLRPKGRSQPRPGETAVFLTEEEINALPA